MKTYWIVKLEDDEDMEGFNLFESREAAIAELVSNRETAQYVLYEVVPRSRVRLETEIKTVEEPVER